MDTFKTINCPACGLVMKKIFIPGAGISVDVCKDGCGGIYFDNQEMQHFHKDSPNIEEINKVLEGKRFLKVDQNQVRICPACGTKMVKNDLGGIGIQIDNCYNCGGIFLDYGEIDLIRAGKRKTVFKKDDIQTTRPKKTDEELLNEIPDSSLIRQFYKEASFENYNKELEWSGWGRRRYSSGSILMDIISALIRP